MWAMPHSTAGDWSGAEPTYCVKWSSIWATRGSGTWPRTHSATVRPRRILSTSSSMAGWNMVRSENMSRSEPIDFQKKKRSEISCNFFDQARKSR